MILLVDYSNIICNSAELEPIVDSLIRRLYPYYWQNVGDSIFECSIRLYDGWDEQVKVVDPLSGVVKIKSQLSRNAQEVARVIASRYPKSYLNVTVHIEMARSLLSAPIMQFPFTLRKKQEFYRLELVEKEQFCCDESKSHYEYLREYVKKHRCCHCKRKEPVLLITEQKLVDTMMVSDLLYLRGKTDCVAIASDDDDMLPGIFQYVTSGGVVYHLRKRGNQLSYNEYCHLFKSLSRNPEKYCVIS